MPVPIEFLRGILGVLCVLFAHMLGRAGAGVYQGVLRKPRMYGWLVRTLVTGLAVMWRSGLDTVTLAVWAAAALAAAAGAWLQLRPREPEEEITLSLDERPDASERQHEDRERGGA